MVVGRDDLKEEEIEGKEGVEGPVFLSYFGTLRGRWHLSFLFVDPWCFETWVDGARAFNRYFGVSAMDETSFVDIFAISRANLCSASLP